MPRENALQKCFIHPRYVSPNFLPVETRFRIQKNRNLTEGEVHIDERHRRRTVGFAQAGSQIHSNGRGSHAALAADKMDDLAFFFPYLFLLKGASSFSKF